jgi:NAD(P)-dependent dehydrogenase (short-subunit alcohol dehydrogenase family)
LQGDNAATGLKMAAGKKKIVVLGGDGFCGWPTSLHLSEKGHDVIIVDNLSRRNIDTEMGCDSLTPIAHPEVRVKAWEEVSGKTIRFLNFDVAKDYQLLVELIRQERPDAIVHFAEQRAAPYSMKSSKHKRYTVDNNVGGTNNLLAAVLVRLRPLPFAPAISRSRSILTCELLVVRVVCAGVFFASAGRRGGRARGAPRNHGRLRLRHVGRRDPRGVPRRDPPRRKQVRRDPPLRRCRHAVQQMLAVH